MATRTVTLSTWEVAAMVEALKFALNHGAPINHEHGKELFEKLDSAIYVRIVPDTEDGPEPERIFPFSGSF